MKMVVHEVAAGWHRVLSVSNVYARDRELLDKHVQNIDGVDFISKDSINSIHRELGRNSFTVDFRTIPKERDYSQDAYLTLIELRSFLLQAAIDYCEENEGLQVYAYKEYGSYYIQIQENTTVKYSGNPYLDTTSETHVLCSIKIQEVETSVFTSQKEKDDFLNAKKNGMLENIERKVSN